MRPVFLLYFPRLSDSVTFRAYLADLGGYNLLDWWIPQLAATADGGDLLALYHDEVDAEPVERIASAHGMLALPAYEPTPLEAWREVAATYPGRPIVVFGPGACLLAPALLGETAARHIAAGAHFTRVNGCPFYSRAEVYDERLLAALHGTGEASCFHNPGNAAEAMERRAIGIGGEVLRVVRVEAEGGCEDGGAAPLSRFHDCFGVEALRRVTALFPAPLERPASRGLLGEWRAAISSRTLPARPTAPPRGPRLRVLYLSDSPGFTGAEQSLCQAVSGVDRSRFEQFGCVSHEGWFATRLRDAGCEVFCPNFPFSVEGEAAHGWALDLLRAVRPAVIHSNAYPGAAVLDAAGEAGVPLVQHARIPSVEDIREPLLRAARVVAVSRFIADRVEQLGVDRRRIQVVYNPVDTDHFRPGAWARDEARRAMGLPADAFVVLMVARLAPMKRHEVLLRAAALLKDKGVALHLALAGESSHAGYAGYVRNVAAELGLEADITWVRFQADIRIGMSAADLLALCSKDEPASRAVLEAMAMQIPCVASHSGGVPEILEHNHTGLFFPEGDHEELAAAIHRLWRDAGERERLGRNARAEISRRFDHRIAAAAMERVFALASGH